RPPFPCRLVGCSQIAQPRRCKKKCSIQDCQQKHRCQHGIKQCLTKSSPRFTAKGISEKRARDGFRIAGEFDGHRTAKPAATPLLRPLLALSVFLSLVLGKSSTCQRAPSTRRAMTKGKICRHRSFTLRQQFTADATPSLARLPD